VHGYHAARRSSLYPGWFILGPRRAKGHISVPAVDVPSRQASPGF
jgi:hypothetical protein